MKTRTPLRVGVVLLTVIHAMAPCIEAGGPSPAVPFRPAVRDVALQAGGTLVGQVLNVQGQPVAGQQLVVVQDNRTLTTVVSDASGRFQITGLHGGLFQLTVPGGMYVCRAWAVGTAPPVATSQLLIAAPEIVLRGQRPFSDLFLGDPILVGLIVAGVIAIPIAISNSKSEPPPES